MPSADASEYVRTRVAELAEAIPERSRGRITMAIALAADETGSRIALVATSEPRGYLRQGVIISEDEILVAGAGHAEQDVVDHVRAEGWLLIDIGATRPICRLCAESIRATGAHISTPLKA